MRMTRSGVLGLGLCGMVGVAVAQPPAEAVSEPMPLAGPKVQRDAPPGVQGRFSEGSERERGRRQRLGQVLGPVRALAGPDAPEGLALTGAQREALQAVVREHRRAISAYMREHAGELRALREQAGLEPIDDRDRRQGRRSRRGAGTPDEGVGRPGPAPAEGRRPRPDVSAMTEAQRAAFERLRAIERGAPPMEPVAKKVWALLTPEQRAHVESKRAEQEAARARQAARAMDEGPVDMQERGALRERMRERLSRMSPEEREEAMQRMRERRRERGGAGADVPPPSMDDVEVPDDG